MSYFTSSIGKKQIVALTGLMLVGFLVGHLAGNLIIYLGPEAYNAYAKKLTGLRPALYVVEFGLLAIFLTHIWFTYCVVRDNIKARGKKYAVEAYKQTRPWSVRLMPYTGSILILFVVLHLIDFTFVGKSAAQNYIDGVNMYVYGRVFNAFKDPFHSFFYILSMACIGFHLTHGIQSTVQTFGFHHKKYTPMIQSASVWIGVVMAVLYSSIPLYILLK